MRRLLFACGVVLLACLGAENTSTKVQKFCAGCKFTAAKLAGSDFTRATYIGVDFEGADLSGSSFRQARLLAINFQNADLRNAAFDGSQCMACNFLGAKLDGATFTGTLMTASNFKGFAASIPDEQLRQLLSGCVACNFAGSNLAGRDLSGIPLLSVDFSQADLSGVRFDGAVLCWNVTQGAKRQATCDTMRGAQTSATNFANVLLCDDPMDRSTCVPVDADMLRQDTGSPLTGAALP